jgi:hypothetical protein
MEKYRFGPLVYASPDMGDTEGNYFWTGNPPVGYDEFGVPIDKNGHQCLDIACPLHPAWKPPLSEQVYNHGLRVFLPTLEFTRSWFDDNFLEISDLQLKKILVKRLRRSVRPREYMYIVERYSSVEEIMEAAWPDEPQS